jgi:tape measure domain-containing protein
MAETVYRIQVIVEPAKAVAGVKQVKGELNKLNDAASKVQGILRKTFLGVSVSLLLRELVQLSDEFVQIQNRLRVVTDSEAELAAVTEDLLGVANRTRSSFQATAELYSRTALATRELGLTQDQTLQFTESLNQAMILSGASAQEARAGSIQLSQGLASNTLRGDELRAVLEQLPVVADVIAKSMGVTRGELRKLGEQGKISAETIITAFRQAQGQLADDFAKTVPTVGQALTVLRNNAVGAAGGLSETNGALVDAILILADAVGGFDELAQAILDLPGFDIQIAQLKQFGEALHQVRLFLKEIDDGIKITNEQSVGTAARIHELELAMANANEELTRDPDNMAAQRAVEQLTEKIRVLQGESGILDERLGNNEETLAQLQDALTLDPGNAGLTQRVAELTDKIAGLKGEIAQLPAAAAGILPQGVTDLLLELGKETELLKLSNGERKIRIALDKEIAALEKQNVPITPAIREQIEAQLRLNAAIEEEQAVLQSIRGPQEDFDHQLLLLEKLYDRGTISTEEYSSAVEALAEKFKDIADLTGSGINLPASAEAQGPTFLPPDMQEFEPPSILPPEGFDQANEFLEAQDALLRGIQGPMQDYQLTLQALDQLQRDNQISAEEYNRALLEIQASSAGLSNTLQQGLTAGLAQIKLEMTDVAGAAQSLVVNAFHNAEDAVVKFVTTGEADLAGFVNSVLADLTRLLLHQAFQSLLGLGVGSGGAGLFNPFGGLGGLAEGGPAEEGKPYIVGEQGPELFTPEDSGTITPAGETAAMMSAQGPPQITVSAPPASVNVFNVSDKDEIPAGIESQAGEQAVLNVLQRNRRRVGSLVR